MGEEGRERCAPVSEGRTQLVRLRASGLSLQPKRKLPVEKKPSGKMEREVRGPVQSNPQVPA